MQKGLILIYRDSRGAGGKATSRSGTGRPCPSLCWQSREWEHLMYGLGEDVTWAPLPWIQSVHSMWGDAEPLEWRDQSGLCLLHPGHYCGQKLPLVSKSALAHHSGRVEHSFRPLLGQFWHLLWKEHSKSFWKREAVAAAHLCILADHLQCLCDQSQEFWEFIQFPSRRTAV